MIWIRSALFWLAFIITNPIAALIGTLLIIAGLAKFFGVNIPIGGSGLEIAVAGWRLKGV